jgi:MFS family permease
MSSWAPLRHKSFRLLFCAWVGASICMFISDVASAWLMTSLTTSPVMIALVQTAATLPIFLLGLPAGALADILDRRRLLIVTQAWAVVVATALFASAITGHVTPVLLLVLVFANGLVLTVRWPTFSALIPELVPRPEVPVASRMSGIANNGSRIIGPLLAGLIITAAGVAWVFAFTGGRVGGDCGCCSSTGRIRRSGASFPGERIAGAIRVGVQHVRQSPLLQMVMTRVSCFFFISIGLIALLPLVAKRLGWRRRGHVHAADGGDGTRAPSSPHCCCRARTCAGRRMSATRRRC